MKTGHDIGEFHFSGLNEGQSMFIFPLTYFESGKKEALCHIISHYYEP